MKNEQKDYKKILMIAYIMPPLSGSGVYRTLKFIKYLPENGWKPIVVCADDPEWHVIDNSSEYGREIPSVTEIYKAKPLRLSRKLASLTLLGWFYRKLGLMLGKRLGYLLAIPDHQANWFVPAVRRSYQLLKKHKDIKLVYTTSAPYTDHLVGLLIKLIVKKPWVADFRDPWSDNVVIFKDSSLFVKQINTWLERQVLKFADCVVTIAEPLAKIQGEKIEKMGVSTKVEVVTNGYDSLDFESLETHLKSEKFTISYVGALYGSRSPEALLKGFLKFLTHKGVDQEKIALKFAGIRDANVAREIETFVTANDLQGVVHLQSHVPHSEALKLMTQSHVLVLILGDDEYKTGGIYPGKVFEYFAAKRPILAIAPEGATADLIRRLRAGVVCGHRGYNAIADFLDSRYGAFLRKTDIFEPAEGTEKFERRLLTRKLAHIFDDLIA